MGDRCYIDITMRRADLPRFAPFIDEQAGDEWWDDEDEHAGHPDLVTVRVYEANYAWGDERQAAAVDGIPFFGSHGEGGEYGPYAFASLDGEQLEVQVNHDGYMVVSVDDNLQMLDDIEHLRAYVAKVRAVKKLFGIGEGGPNGRSDEEDARPDQPQGDPAVPAGVRGA